MNFVGNKNRIMYVVTYNQMTKVWTYFVLVFMSCRMVWFKKNENRHTHWGNGYKPICRGCSGTVRLNSEKPLLLMFEKIRMPIQSSPLIEHYFFQEEISGSRGGREPLSARERRRRRERDRRRTNTKWALCLYIMPAAVVLLGLMVAIIVLQVVYFVEGEF